MQSGTSSAGSASPGSHGKRPSAIARSAQARVAGLTWPACFSTTCARAARSCLLCHRIGDEGNEYGPGLAGFARGQAAEVVVQALIDPSAEIAHGYEGVDLQLTDGTRIHGRLLTTGDPVVVQSMGGLTQLVPASRIKGTPRRPLGRSLMLSAEQLGLSAQDVADVVAYLRTL